MRFDAQAWNAFLASAVNGLPEPFLFEPRLHRRPRSALLSLLLCAGAVARAPGMGLAAGDPPAPRAETFTEHKVSAPIHVLDGDTFEADLNADGRVDTPEERVRLLFVDTPELGKSDRGADPARGEAARVFLAAWMERGRTMVLVPEARSRDNYGRALAILIAGNPGADAESHANWQLVRHGHSHFDTRFTFPREYDRYADAEGAAFSERLGIWSDETSRERYLGRLQREWKTPRSAANPLYGGEFRSLEFSPRALLGKYVRVTGRITMADGSQANRIRFELEHSPGKAPVRGVVFPPLVERLPLTRWPPGTLVTVEGFVQGYRNQPTVVLHYTAPLPAVTWRQAGTQRF